MLEQGIFTQFKKLIDSGVPVPTSKEWREARRFEGAAGENMKC